MAFPASNQIPVDGYQRAKKLSLQAQRQAQGRSTSFAAGATSAEVLAAADNLKSFRDQLNDIRSIAGIAAYAKVQEDNPALDVVAEFIALIAAIDAAITEIVATLPKDVNGWLLVNKINADGSLTPRNFTGAQLAGLITKMDAIVAAVS